MAGGMNNQSYRLVSDDDKSLFLKIYAKDERNRLTREYGAYSYLRGESFNDVPVPIYKSDLLNYGVYSFEVGRIKKVEELTQSDLKKMADFVIKLQQLRPPYDKFPSAVKATFSNEEFSQRINNRLNHFSTYLSTRELDSEVKVFVNYIDLIEVLKKQLTKLFERRPGIQDNSNLRIDQRCLSSADFGPHNIIMKKNGDFIYFDFEYFGWDDPANILAMFLTDEKSKDLDEKSKDFIIQYYKKHSTLPSQLTERLEIMISAFKIDWIALILDSLSPDRMKHYLEANPKLESTLFVQGQIDKIKRLLKGI